MNKICTKTLTVSAAALVAASSSAFAASGTYTNAASGGVWSDVANWSSGTIADGAGFTADFSTLDITGNNTVSLDGNRTLGTLKFADTTASNSWAIAASGAARSITMDNSGSVASVDVAGGSVSFQNAATASPITFNVGSNGFDKTGAGSMIINSDGNGSANWAGSGLVTVKGGSLVLKQFSGNTSFTGNYQVDSGATLQVAANNSGGALYGTGIAANSKTITLNGGSLSINRSSASTFNLNQKVDGIAVNSEVKVASGHFTQDSGAVISGNTKFTVNNASSTATLSAVNTFTGSTSVTNGTLTLADNAGLKFVIGASGTNNAITGAGTLNLDGDFTFDLTAAATAGSWQIVNNSTLIETYGTTFSVVGFTDNGNNTWSTTANGATYTFSEATGALSAVPEPGAALLGGLGLMALLRRRRL